MWPALQRAVAWAVAAPPLPATRLAAARMAQRLLVARGSLARGRWEGEQGRRSRKVEGLKQILEAPPAR